MKHYVYAISMLGYIKIGITSDINRRINSMNTANPVEIKIEKCIEVSSRSEASRIEIAIHKKLKNMGLHSRLEWFVDIEKCINVLTENCIEQKYESNELESLRLDCNDFFITEIPDFYHDVGEKITFQLKNQLDAVIAYFGSKSDTAKSLSISRQVVSNWVKRGAISKDGAEIIQQKTNGKFKASEMRPDVKQWRNK